MTTKKDTTLPATEFKARCLELMDSVRDSGASITITKHGKPVARLVPISTARSPLAGSLPVTIVGDIVSPLGEPWDAER
jgi:prevent-host-death family protein